MVTAIFPGTFDPVTVGHLDLVRRALPFFDQLVVAVGDNAAKQPLFPARVRADMVQAALNADCAEDGGGGILVRTEQLAQKVSVVIYTGLLVDCAAEVGADVVVKGLRTGADFDYELVQATHNRDLSGLETLFLPTSPQWRHVSSSGVRELMRWGADVSALVPASVLATVGQPRPRAVEVIRTDSKG